LSKRKFLRPRWHTTIYHNFSIGPLVRKELADRRVERRSSLVFVLLVGEVAQRPQRGRDASHQRLLELPDGGVHDARLPVLLAALLQGLDAVGAVVVELGVAGLDRVGGAATAEARQREVVVQGQHLLRVVETLDVLAGFGEVFGAIHVLQHVHVPGDLLEPAVVVEEVVQEVDVAHVVRRPLLLVDFERFGQDLVHQALPGGAVERHDHLVDVQQGDVLVLVHVLVEAVVVGDQLVLALVVGLLGEIEVLEGGGVGLAPCQINRSHVNLPLLFVVFQHFTDIRVDLQLVEEDFVGPQKVQQFDPLDQTHRQVFVQEVQAFDAHRKVFLLRWFLEDHPQIVGGVVASLLHQRNRLRHLLLVLLRNHARRQVRLINPLLVVPPLLVPDVLVLEALADHRFLLPVEPKLAVRHHRGFYPVDHPQDSDSRTQSIVGSLVQISPEQLERPIGGPQGLPVQIVELQIEHAGESGTSVVHSHGFVLVLVPVDDGQVRHSLLDVLYQFVFREGWALVDERFEVVGFGGGVGVTCQRVQSFLEEETTVEVRHGHVQFDGTELDYGEDDDPAYHQLDEDLGDAAAAAQHFGLLKHTKQVLTGLKALQKKVKVI
jgi:hypothetical protein